MRVIKRCESDSHPHYRPTLRRRRSKADRFARYVQRHYPTAKDLEITLNVAFTKVAESVPAVSMRRGILGGTPCIKGTRIPVYMVLDAVEYYGDLQGAIKSYPDLTLDQVKGAVRFAKLVLECPVDNTPENPS